MKYSEKLDEEEITQKEDKNSDINDNTTNYEENQNNSNNNIKKKNRTLQYYKFLFYTMKTEIKVHDFLKLIRNTNTLELSLWTISIVLYANVPKNFPILKPGEKNKSKYSGAFLWFHILHVVRACIGMFVGYKLPRSFQIMDFLQDLSKEKLAKTLFNDIIRETIYNKVILVIRKYKVHIFLYFLLTILNIIIDVIEFFYILFKIPGISDSARIEFITYFIINIIYLHINFSYIFYFGQLKYIFPPIYLNSISKVYICLSDTVRALFKLKKEKTNVIDENKAQHKNGPFVANSGDNNNGGVNILDYIVRDSFGINLNNKNNYAENNSNKYLPDINDKNKNRNINNNIDRKSYPDSSENMN